VNAASSAEAAATLRDLDRDRYFATLVLPSPERPAVQALFAFSVEIAAIRERVREPMPGEIRLQWWADALAGKGHGEVRQNPLADALLDAIAGYRLPTQPLLRLIEARRFDLYQDPMPDLPTFEGYAGETVSVLYQLAAMILNAGNPVDCADAAGHLGVAQALIGHLRAFGYNAARGQIFLPWSIFAANGVRRETVFAGGIDAGLLVARTQLVEIASEHLARAEGAMAELPRRLRSAFASTAILRGQLNGLRRMTDQPYASPAEQSDLGKLASLLWQRRF
jgi:phytoene synthase